jgi:hypothetical protein
LSYLLILQGWLTLSSTVYELSRFAAGYHVWMIQFAHTQVRFRATIVIVMNLRR